jgi:hypothetical protein
LGIINKFLIQQYDLNNLFIALPLRTWREKKHSGESQSEPDDSLSSSDSSSSPSSES